MQKDPHGAIHELVLLTQCKWKASCICWVLF